MMFRCYQFVLIVLVGFAMFGCSTTCIVEVESTRRSDLVGVPDAGIVYQLDPNSKNLLNGETQYESFASQVEFVLDGLGYVPLAETGQDIPEQLIELSYGISNPIQKSYTYYDHGYMGARCCSCPPMICSCSSGYYQRPIERTGYYYVYRRWVTLTANEVGNNNKEPAWETKATSLGRSDDMNKVLPLMLLAMEPFIGKNGRDVVRKSLNDVRFKELSE